MGHTARFLFVSLCTIPIRWFEGWTAVKMWEWFVLPVFSGLPTFTAWQATGIMLATRMLMPTHSDYFPNENDESRFKKALYNMGYSPFVAVSCLIVGWLIKTFAL